MGGSEVNPLKRFNRSDFNELRSWVNHTVEGSKQRNQIALRDSMKIWNKIYTIIEDIKKIDLPDEVQLLFLESVPYIGKLYRVHKKYDKSKDFFGISESDYLNSWTKEKSLDNMYWLSGGQNVLFIETKTSQDAYGIDLNKLDEFFCAVYKVSFMGNFNLSNEQEVVFPIKYNLITSCEIKIIPTK